MGVWLVFLLRKELMLLFFHFHLDDGLVPVPKENRPLYREVQLILDLYLQLITMFRSVGVYVVLFWSVSSLFPYNQLVKDTAAKRIELKVTVAENAAITIYPILGWIADVYYGRYRVIKCSLRIMWVVSCLQCLLHMLSDLLKAFGTMTGDIKYIEVLCYSLKIIMSAAVGGVLTNIVLLGIDQLVDAPSFKIASFIRWYGWVWFLADFTVSVTQTCFCTGYELAYRLEIPILLTIALCLDFFCSKYLLKEPVFPNPLTLIYRVLKYAWKNKYPHLPSAYTYWDGRFFSRIDLAKTKFGGPFSTVQVEDVKTLGHIVLLICFGSIIPTLIIYINNAKDTLLLHLEDTSYSKCGCNKDCLWRASVENFGAFFVVVLIPIFEVFLFPFLKNHFEIRLFSRMITSILLVAMSVCGFGIVEVVGYYQSQLNKMNQTCIFNLTEYSENAVLPLSFNWFILPDVFLGVGKYILLTSVLEFLCAQSPSSMKGFLFGLVYVIGGVSLVVNLAWFIPLQKFIKKWSSAGIVELCTFLLCLGSCW